VKTSLTSAPEVRGQLGAGMGHEEEVQEDARLAGGRLERDRHAAGDVGSLARREDPLRPSTVIVCAPDSW
jgi:hypothetical protein